MHQLNLQWNSRWVQLSACYGDHSSLVFATSLAHFPSTFLTPLLHLQQEMLRFDKHSHQKVLAKSTCAAPLRWAGCLSHPVRQMGPNWQAWMLLLRGGGVVTVWEVRMHACVHKLVWKYGWVSNRWHFYNKPTTIFTLITPLKTVVFSSCYYM